MPSIVPSTRQKKNLSSNSSPHSLHLFMAVSWFSGSCELRTGRACLKERWHRLQSVILCGNACNSQTKKSVPPFDSVAQTLTGGRQLAERSFKNGVRKAGSPDVYYERRTKSYGEKMKFGVQASAGRWNDSTTSRLNPLNRTYFNLRLRAIRSV